MSDTPDHDQQPDRDETNDETNDESNDVTKDESGDESKDRGERAGGRAVLVVVAGLVLLAAGGWAAAYAFAGDGLPNGTTVSGVEIGGRSPADAARVLEAELGGRIEEPVEVTVGDERVRVTPREAGLGVDYDASVAEAGGQRTWDPRVLWDHYTGGDDLDAVVTVDDTVLAQAVARLDDAAGTPARDGAVAFETAQIEVTDPVVGAQVDPDATRTALVAAFLAGDDTAEVPLREVAPDIDDDDVSAALDGFANPALSGPVTLVFGDSPVRLVPRQFSRVLRLRAEDGELVPDLRTKRLQALVAGAVSQDEPVDATVALVGGRPKVVPAKPGVTFDPADVSDAFLDLVVRPAGEREVEVEATVAEPEITTADAQAWRIREQVSSFTTYFPYADYRNVNIGRAAELVTGTVLEPGETFSLNDTVGERTRENGFTEGFIISDGIFKEDLGGGVSQMATTTFNAAFFAGLEDVEHKAHSFYIDRYPVGREATVAWGAVDLRFRNDTPYGVLIDAEVTPSTPSSQGVVTVSMYSTKVWDVTSTTSDRYAFVEPETRRLDTPDCYPNSGYAGFQVDVTREFRKPGQPDLERREIFHTDYTASDTVICQPPPEPAAR